MPGVGWPSAAPHEAVIAATPRDALRTTGRLRPDGVPFADDRVTAGSETELQVTVQGRADAVDLPLMMASRFYANLLKRSTARDTPKKALRELQRILRDERGGVWENSWVRFSRERLSPAAQRQLISDNVSPETCSFYVSALAGGSEGGRRLARETAERFLLTHLLVAYANQTFGLLASGQRAIVHFSPHTPLRQRQLNECISDASYRELFTSPCLSGWDRGEDKHAYMRLCHEVLSRSQLYAAAKVRDAGLIATDR